MLILTMHIDDEITIGDDVTIRCCRIKRGKAVIGFDAPQRVVIKRIGNIHDRTLHCAKTSRGTAPPVAEQ